MKTEELTALGLTEEQVKQVFALHGKAIDAYKNTITGLETERNDLNTRLKTAEDTLKGFGDMNPEQIKQEIQSYKTQAEEAERNYNRQITERDQKDWINKQLDEYGVASSYARRQLMADCMAEEGGLVWKDGAYIGFADFMKSAKEHDASLYQTAEEKEASEKEAKLKKEAPAFTVTEEKEKGKDKKYTPPKVF